MIDRIQIKNFRCFESFCMEEVKPINFIGGRNNSGKSSILEAIFLALGLKKFPAIAALEQNRVNRHDAVLDMDKFWDPFFFNFTASNNITVQLFEKEKIFIEMGLTKQFEDRSLFSLKEENVFDSQIPIMDRRRIKSINGYCKGHEQYKCTIAVKNNAFEVKFSGLKGNDYKAFYYIANQRNNSQIIAEWISRMIFSGEKGFIVEALQIFEADIDDVVTFSENKETFAYVVFKNKTRMPVNYMGDGINKALQILMEIFMAGNGIVLVDEVENGFHYSIYEKILTMFFVMAQKVGCQLFFTTHNIELLNAAMNVMRNIGRLADLGYHRIDFSQNKRKPFAFSGEEIQRALDYGMEVR